MQIEIVPNVGEIGLIVLGSDLQPAKNPVKMATFYLYTIVTYP